MLHFSIWQTEISQSLYHAEMQFIRNQELNTLKKYKELILHFLCNNPTFSYLIEKISVNILVVFPKIRIFAKTNIPQGGGALRDALFQLKDAHPEMSGQIRLARCLKSN